MNSQTPSARILYKSCPLCTSQEILMYYEADCTKHHLYNSIIGNTIKWMKCKSCKHVFTDGYFTPEAERVVFSKTNPNQTTGHDIENQRIVSAKMVEKVLPYLKSGDWLDIGFGNGSLLFTAQEYGFHPVGIDLRIGNVMLLMTYGIEAHCVDIHKFQQPGRFSVISMADVLEHVPYPKPFLQTAHKLLKDQGLVLISMPNMDSQLWKTLDKTKRNPYWSEIEHYHNFGKDRLYSLLSECGFEALDYGISARYRACMELVARKIS